MDTLFKNKLEIQGLNILHFKKLLDIATKDILFYYNGKLYKLIEGLVLGSPLGPTLANIFMFHYKYIWLKYCPESFKPCYFFKYVDDTLLLFKCTNIIILTTWMKNIQI